MAATKHSTIRTRFAPSPSGHLHVGGARTALFCYAYAKGRGGRFILRVEDTDQKRSSNAAAMAFLEDLRWLGLEWDEGPEHEGIGGGDKGPYFSSQRLNIYNQHLERLIEAGKAYRAFETPEELAAARELARTKKQNYRYNRAALELDKATIEHYLTENKPHVVRLKIPDDADFTFTDEVRGEIRIAADELDDFVIRKADGRPTYHFAVVVDDELMGVTHIIRGQEHLYNTPRHVLLQDALGFRRPVYAHLSLIFNPDGSKMSKRDKDKTLRKAANEKNMQGPPKAFDSDALAVPDEKWKNWQANKDHQLDFESAQSLAKSLQIRLPEINVDDFRRAGYLPEVLINYLALLGWSPGQDIEKFDLDYLSDKFNFDRVIKGEAMFDREKLLAFNLDALQSMEPDDFVRKVREHAGDYHPEYLDTFSEDIFALFAKSNQARSKTLEDPFKSCGFFLCDDNDIEYEQTRAVRKALCNGEPNGYEHLQTLRPQLEALDEWTIETLEETIKGYTEEHANGKLGKVAQPLRIAVSGGTISPAIFDTLLILGKSSVLNRIDKCLTTRETLMTNAT